jgi:hypothetical protein
MTPSAYVQAAFDEARALAECKALLERRDEAKGEFKDAVLLLGQKLTEARRAMPGVIGPGGHEKYSPAFRSFIGQLGLALTTAKGYISFARNPARLAASRKRHYSGMRRVRVLKEVAELLAQAPDIETARRVIQEELSEVK